MTSSPPLWLGDSSLDFRMTVGTQQHALLRFRQEQIVGSGLVLARYLKRLLARGPGDGTARHQRTCRTRTSGIYRQALRPASPSSSVVGLRLVLICTVRNGFPRLRP
jgi:hypothetical protein